MNKESKDFLYDLLNTPSPTGYEQEIQRVVKKRMEQYADSIETDLHGNLIVGINTSAKRKVMLAGHCDQIGFLITHITEDGYIYFTPLGGIDGGVLFGAHITIRGKNGPVSGVVGRKPIHMQKPEERKKASIETDKMWIDIGAKNKKEAEKKVEVGNTATFKLGVTELSDQLVCSPGLDDKSGVFVVMEALRLCAKGKLSVGLYSVSTVQEEVGLRGARTAAYGIDPEVGLGIDVTHATDDPSTDDKKKVPCKLGSGPCISAGPNTNPVVQSLLETAAKKGKIPWQTAPNNRPLGNDTNAIQINRSGVATASIGIPNRYMHTQVEVCSLNDLENSAKVIAAFVKSITPKTDFRPK